MKSKRGKKHRYLPTLALSMIVKNEEKFLEGCLESVKDIVDEIVIVDTGSTDGTKEIAEHYGARIFDFEWTGDFSEARNSSLNQCTAEWVLYLDADERVAEGHGPLLQSSLRNRNVGAYNLMIESEHTFDHGTVRQSNAYPRLFRKLPGVRFEGKVHEQILPSLQQLNLAILQSNITITHLGYAQGADVLKQKSHRNIELLRKQLAQNPEDAYARFQLGNTHVVLKEFDAAKIELDRAVASDRLPGSSRATAYNLLAEVEVKRNNLAGAAAFCHKSLAIAPNQLMAHWFLALILCDMKRFEEAIEPLARLVKLFDVPATKRSMHIASDLELNKGEAVLRLAFCYEQGGKFRDAMHSYAQAFEILPDSAEALNGFLRTQDKVNDSKEAIRQLLSVSERHPKRTEFFLPLAFHYRRIGDVRAALKFIDRTLSSYPTNAEVHACAVRWQMEAGDTAEAERILAEAEKKSLRAFDLHKCGLELALKRRDVSSAFRHLELMTQTTTADLSPLRHRISALATKLGTSTVS